MSYFRKNILVGIDLSECSERALGTAVELAEKMVCDINLVHVYQFPPPPALTAVMAMPEYTGALDSTDEEIRRLGHLLEDLCARVVSRRVLASIHLRHGDPVLALIAAIKEMNPVMVVLGTHGRSGVKRFLLGSVSEQVCRRSPVPVLVVPPASHAQETHASSDAAKEAPTQPTGQRDMAYSCAACGHIRGGAESDKRCTRCGKEPAQWIAAPISHRQIDEIEPSIGGVVAELLAPERSNDPAALFPISPPGTEGYDVNPELRVRY